MPRDIEPVGPTRVVVAPGDRAPRHSDGWGFELPIDRGDVLVVACEAQEAEVVHVDDDTVVLEWPWVDRAAGDRRVALLVDAAHRDHSWSLWRFDPDPAQISDTGCRVRVSVPPTVVHACYDEVVLTADERSSRQPPPDHAIAVAVLPHGVSECRATTDGPVDQRILLYPWGPEPFTMALVHRPYPWLQDGDEVLDSTGGRWAFYKPLWWVGVDDQRADTKPLAAPMWPLSLVERHGSPPSESAALAVAAGTATGSHDQEVEAWRAASGADLIPPEHEGAHDDLLQLDDAARADEAARTRADLVGLTIEQIAAQLDEARHWHHNVSKIVHTAEDQKRVDRAGVRLDEITRVYSWLQGSGLDHYHGQPPEARA
jgi:hypothetical protein